MSKKKVTLSIESKIYFDFQKYCEDNAIMLSKKIEIFMKTAIESKGKKNLMIFLSAIIFLIISLNLTLAESGTYWDRTNLTNSLYNIIIHNNILRTYNGTDYSLINLSVNPSNYSTYIYQSLAPDYRIYFRNNSNTAEPVRFEKDGYFFIYDISGSNMQWHEQPGFPARTDTLGGGCSSNSQNSYASINDNTVSYNGAFCNTNVTYSLTNTMLKENFILSGLPSIKAYTYLEYTGNIKFNKSLKICANNQCYIPSGSQDDFNTSGKIEFQDSNNITRFYLSEPIIRDSNGSSTTGIYFVRGSDAQMNFDLRIPTSFIQTAVFPIFIDPTIAINGSTGGGGDAEVRSDLANQNYGSETDFLVKSGTPKRNSYLKFNISSVPDNQIIDNVSLCSYLYNDLSSQTIGAYGVYSNWDESTIIWNNQPCGTNFDNPSNCNLTAESNLLNDGTKDNSWQCWNIVNFIKKQYENGNRSISIVLHTEDSGSADSFYSKEHSNSSLWPYINITYHPADNTPPNFSNFIENPINSSGYVSSQEYRFNATIIDENLRTVGIEFNGTNYTGSIYINNISNVFVFNISNLAVGTYSYYWWANDSIGNFNKSQTRHYTISKGENTIQLLPSGGWGDRTYPAEVTFSCSAIYGTPNLYINNTQVTNPITITLSAGFHNIKCNISESQNYSIGMSQGTLTVNKATPILTFLANGGTNNLTLNYPIQINISAKSNYGTVGLDIDNLDYLSSNSLNKSLAAGSYIFRANVTGNSNYSDISYSYYNITINKASSQTSLTFDKTSPQNYGNTITPACSIISGVGTPELRMNENIISSGISLNLGAGTYNFNCSLNSSENYSYSENITSFIINKISSTTILTTSPNFSIIYGAFSNFLCINSEGLNSVLYINGINKTIENNLNIVRAAGNYIINCTTFGNQNYSDSSTETNYTINKANGNVYLYLNGIEYNLTIDYPEQYNITATTLYGNVAIYKDGINISFENGNNITPSRNSGFYNITAVSFGDENYSFISETRWLNVTLDSVAPIIELVSPQEGGSYGYNESLPLDYSVNDEHPQSCWYNIDNGINISLSNCQNTTFNISNDGNYIVYLYANDSLGNTAIKNATFSIIVGAPTIILNSPISIYLNSNNVNFRYIPSDIDLRSCELWGNFDGSWKLNQTDNNPISDIENIFNLNLSDGTYMWNIRCNDSMGHFAYNGNKSFSVDTMAPTISISEPIGKKSSWIGIPLTYIINDASPVNCKYSVSWSTGGIVISNTTLINCNSINFNLSSVGDYILTLYAEDNAGNSNFSSLGFSVDNSNNNPPPSGGGSAGGGGGGGGGSSGGSPRAGNLTSSSKISENNIEITPIETIVYPGEEKSLDLNVKNNAVKSVNKCKLKTSDSQKSWISSSDIKNIAAGEIVDFAFTLKVPGDFQQLDLYLECLELSKQVPIKIILIKPSLNAQFLEISPKENNQLLVKYTIESESDIKTNLIFSVYAESKKIGEQTQEIKLIKGQKINQEILLKLENPEAGLLKISIRKEDEEKPLIEDSVLYGSSKLTGYSLFDDVTSGGNMYIYMIGFVFILLTGIITFKIIKNMRNNKKYNRLLSKYN